MMPPLRSAIGLPKVAGLENLTEFHDGLQYNLLDTVMHISLSLSRLLLPSDNSCVSYAIPLLSRLLLERGQTYGPKCTSIHPFIHVWNGQKKPRHRKLCKFCILTHLVVLVNQVNLATLVILVIMENLVNSWWKVCLTGGSDYGPWINDPHRNSVVYMFW